MCRYPIKNCLEKRCPILKSRHGELHIDSPITRKISGFIDFVFVCIGRSCFILMPKPGSSQQNSLPFRTIVLKKIISTKELVSLMQTFVPHIQPKPRYHIHHHNMPRPPIDLHYTRLWSYILGFTFYNLGGKHLECDYILVELWK